jgi:hypothetical protein
MDMVNAFRGQRATSVPSNISQTLTPKVRSWLVEGPIAGVRFALVIRRGSLARGQAGQSSVAELCRAFGISRTLGYRYPHGFWEHGDAVVSFAGVSPPRFITPGDFVART